MHASNRILDSLGSSPKILSYDCPTGFYSGRGSIMNGMKKSSKYLLVCGVDRSQRRGGQSLEKSKKSMDTQSSQNALLYQSCFCRMDKTITQVVSGITTVLLQMMSLSSVTWIIMEHSGVYF
mmetsp:Transcript_3195/g.12226  ORF Transcript_3195/g.12226 Transcript_3195/m.12226 type:complete len:122 (-) Transcript_3195:442-807(-)